jgi:hypothetical protein
LLTTNGRIATIRAIDKLVQMTAISSASIALHLSRILMHTLVQVALEEERVQTQEQGRITYERAS